MSSPEGEASAAQQPPSPFTLAARFPSERSAGRAYFGIQQTVFRAAHSELSVYRFQLSEVYHVAVLGEQPTQSLEQRLRTLLRAGEFITLPDDILLMLWQRRLEAGMQGGWTEGHYRPGIHL